MSIRLAARPPSLAVRRLPSRRIGGVFLTLAMLALLNGCATGSSRGSPTGGGGPRSGTTSFRDPSAPRRPEATPSCAEATGGSGELPEDTADAFQVVQEASGLGEDARHPAGAALYLEQARPLLGELARTPVTHRNFAPRRNDALRRVDVPPLGELGLGKDWLNAALDGAQDAVAEMAVALAHSLLHPIRTVEDLAQLPGTLARLLASSPEYFARYGAMSREDQIREAARLSTHLLMLLGSAEATLGRMGGLGAQLPVLSLTARGELVLSGAAASTTGGMDLGALSILHMAGSGQANSGGASAKKGKSSQTTATKGPGQWTYKKPTTESKRALDYQEQVTGRPAWYVYMVGKVEFDGFTGKQLLEAKGPGYCSFFNPDGTPKYWYKNSGSFEEMMRQADRQSKLAQDLGLPLTWHVADAKVAEFLRKEFKSRDINHTSILHTRPTQ